MFECLGNFPLTVTKRAAQPFGEVQRRVAALLKDKVLVGHAVFNDLKARVPIMSSLFLFFIFYFLYLTVFLWQALLLSHPFPSTRDTQQLAYKYKLSKGRRPALRNLTAQEFGIQIQGGEHSSVRLIHRTLSAAPHVFTFACRLQTPGPQWQYTVYIDVSGTRGRACCYHLPRVRVAWTSPEYRRNGNIPTVKGTTIRLVVGRKV